MINDNFPGTSTMPPVFFEEEDKSLTYTLEDYFAGLSKLYVDELPAKEQQIGGSHYHQGTIQPWDIIKEWRLDFWEGNVIKYMLRWKHKDGLQDLKKAKHYLEYLIEKNSYDAIRKNAHRIDILSTERITTEVNKMISSKRPSKGFRMMFDTGLLHRFFPEMAKLHGTEKIDGLSHKDNFFHTLQVLDNLAETSDNLWLRWSAILHDIAKPPTKRFEPGIGWTFHGHEDLGARWVPKIFARMKLPLDHQMKYVQKMVQLHLRPIALTKEEITDSAIRRLLFETGDDIDDLMLLCKADITSKNEAKVQRYLSNYELVKLKLEEVEKKDHIRNFQPPISGEMIMNTFGITPGREVGIIKNAIKDAILDGVIHNEYDDAYQFMLSEANKLGLQKVG